MKVKGTGPRKPNSSYNLPDFYSYPFVPQENNLSDRVEIETEYPTLSTAVHTQVLSLGNMLMNQSSVFEKGVRSFQHQPLANYNPPTGTVEGGSGQAIVPSWDMKQVGCFPACGYAGGGGSVHPATNNTFVTFAIEAMAKDLLNGKDFRY